MKLKNLKMFFRFSSSLYAAPSKALGFKNLLLGAFISHQEGEA